MIYFLLIVILVFFHLKFFINNLKSSYKISSIFLVSKFFLTKKKFIYNLFMLFLVFVVIVFLCYSYIFFGKSYILGIIIMYNIFSGILVRFILIKIILYLIKFNESNFFEVLDKIKDNKIYLNIKTIFFFLKLLAVFLFMFLYLFFNIKVVNILLIMLPLANLINFIFYVFDLRFEFLEILADVVYGYSESEKLFLTSSGELKFQIFIMKKIVTNTSIDIIYLRKFEKSEYF